MKNLQKFDQKANWANHKEPFYVFVEYSYSKNNENCTFYFQFFKVLLSFNNA